MNAHDIEAQAMEWLLRLEALEVSGERENLAEGRAATVRAEFTVWREADSRHYAAYIRLRSAWRKADQLKRLSSPDGTVDIDLLAPPLSAASSDSQPAKAQTKLPRRPFRDWRIAWAAAPVLALVGGLAWLTIARWTGETYVTGVGGFERILLTDGSTVELDTNSKVRVRLTDRHRRVELLQGRANFKVAHDAQRPFEVEVAQTTVRALGTAFSVRLRDSERVEVLVTEGRVTVLKSPSRALSPARAPGPEYAAPVLSAGEAAIVEPIPLSVQALPVERPEIARQLSWTQGRLTFDGETLEEAVDEFNRYNPRALVIADPTIASIKIGGSFQPTDPQSFVTALERSFGVRVQFADPKEIRLMRAAE